MWKADDIDSHRALAFFIGRIDTVDRIDEFFDGPACEVIAEYVHADAFVGCLESPHGLFDSVDWTRTAEWIERTHTFENRTSPGWRIGNPVSAVLLEHVFALIAHHLDTFQRGVDRERFTELLDDLGPYTRIQEHTSRRIDDEYQVFAVNCNSADRIVATLKSGAEQ